MSRTISDPLHGRLLLLTGVIAMVPPTHAVAEEPLDLQSAPELGAGGSVPRAGLLAPAPHRTAGAVAGLSA